MADNPQNPTADVTLPKEVVTHVPDPENKLANLSGQVELRKLPGNYEVHKLE